MATVVDQRKSFQKLHFSQLMDLPKQFSPKIDVRNLPCYLCITRVMKNKASRAWRVAKRPMTLSIRPSRRNFRFCFFFCAKCVRALFSSHFLFSKILIYLLYMSSFAVVKVLWSIHNTVLFMSIIFMLIYDSVSFTSAEILIVRERNICSVAKEDDFFCIFSESMGMNVWKFHCKSPLPKFELLRPW